MGGPENLDAVRPYLYNIFSDRTIIRLPGGAFLQKPLARIISSARAQKVQNAYREIGGGSPLAFWTESQRAQIEKQIRSYEPPFRCFVGMRYTEPDIESSIAEAIREDFGRICFMPMYPQYCRATTGSSFEIVSRVMQRHSDVQFDLVKDFHNHPAYISLLKSYIEANIDPEETLLFSAHAVPAKLAESGDPYVEQVRMTASLAAGRRDYIVSFQSRTGPVKWIGPDTVAEVTRLLSKSPRGVFIVPISFVCDHIETLYEIDIDLKRKVPPQYASRIRRMPMFNEDSRLAELLAGIIAERMVKHVYN